jgi:hypothetical protein
VDETEPIEDRVLRQIVAHRAESSVAIARELGVPHGDVRDALRALAWSAGLPIDEWAAAGGADTEIRVRADAVPEHLRDRVALG